MALNAHNIVFLYRWFPFQELYCDSYNEVAGDHPPLVLLLVHQLYLSTAYLFGRIAQKARSFLSSHLLNPGSKIAENIKSLSIGVF